MKIEQNSGKMLSQTDLGDFNPMIRYCKFSHSEGLILSSPEFIDKNFLLDEKRTQDFAHFYLKRLNTQLFRKWP